MIKEATEILSSGHDLTSAQMGAVMEEIMRASQIPPKLFLF